MVGPTNLKPRAASSFDIARDSAVSAGTCLVSRNLLTFGLPSRKSHSSAEKPGPFSMTSSQARADSTAPSILSRLRTMPASCISVGLLARVVARDLLRLEAVEGAAEILALAQDRDPRQPGLEAVEHQLLVERAVVVFRHAPFVVVIGDVERVVLARPGAAVQAVGVQECARSSGGLLARPCERRPVRLAAASASRRRR